MGLFPCIQKQLFQGEMGAQAALLSCTVDGGVALCMFLATASTAKKGAQEGSPQLDAQDVLFLMPEAIGF